jgi:hypothetical protein
MVLVGVTNVTLIDGNFNIQLLVGQKLVKMYSLISTYHSFIQLARNTCTDKNNCTVPTRYTTL